MRILLLSVLLFLVIKEPFKRFDLHVRLDEPQALVKNVCKWIKSENYDKGMVYYYDPMVCFLLDKDPKDSTQIKWLFNFKDDPDKNMPENSIIVWDAHFGPNEGGMPLQGLKDKRKLKLLKVFKPRVEFKVLGGYVYEIDVFKVI